MPDYVSDFRSLSSDTFTLNDTTFYVVPYYDAVVREDGRTFKLEDYGLNPDSAYVINNTVLIHFNVDHDLIPFSVDYFLKGES